METFISYIAGNWSLTAGSEERSGSYTFDRETGVLKELGGDDVGCFSCDTISDRLPIDLDADATEVLPCFRITNSEIMAEIQNPENDRAYFVLPSQLNGAEYPSPSRIVRQINAYKADNTGGPRGQLSVHPAAGQFIIDNASCADCPTGINAIDDILKHCDEVLPETDRFELVNGYLKLPMPRTFDDAEKACEAFRGRIHYLRPLVMENVCACGITPDMKAFSKARHKVSLVYASAVPFNSYCNRCETSEQKDLHSKVAFSVLAAQYYGALKRAASRGSGQSHPRTRIFLMLLGGGVFNNPLESIAKAMSLAAEMLTESERSSLDIRVLTWAGDSRECRVMSTLLTKYGKLLDS